MTEAEVNAAVEKLVAAANEESEKASREYEEACRQKKYAAAENHTLRSSFLEEALETLKTDHEALLKKIQDELDESLMALYAENVAGSGTGEGINPDDAPYDADYTLNARDRYLRVKDYYLSYSDLNQAYDDLSRDEIAMDYLGSYYYYLLRLQIGRAHV